MPKFFYFLSIENRFFKQCYTAVPRQNPSFLFFSNVFINHCYKNKASRRKKYAVPRNWKFKYLLFMRHLRLLKKRTARKLKYKKKSLCDNIKAQQNWIVYKNNLNIYTSIYSLKNQPQTMILFLNGVFERAFNTFWLFWHDVCLDILCNDSKEKRKFPKNLM